jgi:proline dehydrogenase
MMRTALLALNRDGLDAALRRLGEHVRDAEAAAASVYLDALDGIKRRRGARLRLLVPFGEDWYGYFMRRLAERPANVLFLLRNVAR